MTDEINSTESNASKFEERPRFCGCCGTASLATEHELTDNLCQSCKSLPIDICEKCGKDLDDDDEFEAICNICFNKEVEAEN